MLKTVDWIVLVLTVVGLTLTVWGAWKAASAVIIDDATATTLSGTYFGGNSALKRALMDQSHAARVGLLLVAGGSAMQCIAIVLQFVTSHK